jgi:hypothetical protein
VRRRLHQRLFAQLDSACKNIREKKVQYRNRR